MLEYDYSKLKGRIVEKCGTRTRFGEMIGIGTTSLVNKLHGRSQFTQKEIDRAMNVLEISPHEVAEYFFTPIREGVSTE